MLDLSQASAATLQPIWLALGVAGAVIVGIFVIAYLVVPAVSMVGRFLARIVRFIGGEIADALRLVGALATGIVFVPLALVNALIGRWSASAHYGRAIEAEGRAVVGAAYRLVLGNPARLLGLQALTEGIEQRVPQVMAAAPLPDVAPSARGMFDGWEIVGTLQGGGSGARLYIAKPSLQKIASLARQGISHAERVVIKSFSLRDGSTLPQIVRESRALPAAKRLGLILEHELNDERFYYITRYVPGDSLSLVTQRMHAAAPAPAAGSGPAGLDSAALRSALGYTADLLSTLSVYHAGGLWHKDVKPDNVIVSDGRAHLVDFGLITPLRSSLTLTTHGTEYFRDPEMVRMALRGAKVHEVDGAKFDLYAVGAVLYAMIENSFPAHGGLSQITRRCPDAVRWIVRRAMTDYDKRYETAGAMMADVQATLNAADPFALRPAELPSFRAGMDPLVPVAASHGMHEWEGHGAGRATAASAVPPAAVVGGPAAAAAGMGSAPGVGGGAQPLPIGGGPTAASAASRAQQRPLLTIANWWTGAYDARVSSSGADAHLATTPTAGAISTLGEAADRLSSAARQSPKIPGSSAAEQLVRARARMQERRNRAMSRVSARRRGFEPAGVNPGVWIAFFLGIGAILAAGVGLSFIGFVALSPRSTPVPQPDRDPLEPAVAEVADDAWRVGAPDADAYAWASSPLEPRSQSCGNVLVLRDPSSYEQTADVRTRRALQALKDAAIPCVGEVVATGSSANADDAATPGALWTDTIASLRREIGVATIGSADARAATAAWLKSYRDTAEGASRPVHAVLWFGRGEDGQPAAWCLVGGAMSGSCRRALVDALKDLDEARDSAAPEPSPDAAVNGPVSVTRSDTRR